VAVVLILAVTGFFIAERIRSHKKRLGSEASVLAKVEAGIAELRRQRHLLLNVAIWYIAPLFMAWAIVFVISIVNAPAHKQNHPLFLVCYAVLAVPLMTWGVWALNRRAVRKKIEPRLEELERLHRELPSQ
jgi:dolichyl-phosphate-mannose--protein O-mannosyl transferase